jgi:hypothetical protein
LNIARTFTCFVEGTRNIQNGNLSTMLRWMVVGLIIMLILAAAFTIGYNAVEG